MIRIRQLSLALIGAALLAAASPASAQDKARFAKQYAAFRAGKSEDEQISGTPLREWPFLTRAQVEEFRYLGIRTVEQFKRGVDEMFRAVDNLNRTMENLNEAAARVNRLLGEIEEPIRVMMPQLTRTVRTADEITSLMEAPVRATAPKVERIVDALGSPGFLTLPSQIGELMQRLGPLAQLAENAGGLFPHFRMPSSLIVSSLAIAVALAALAALLPARSATKLKVADALRTVE